MEREVGEEGEREKEMEQELGKGEGMKYSGRRTENKLRKVDV